MPSPSPRHCITCVIFVLGLSMPFATGDSDGGNLVNAVLGNGSVSASAGETARVRAHLETVLHRLTQADVSSLTPPLRDARARNIARLREYARDGLFPSKPASIPWRVPNFVDDSGALCAVGYLLERDRGMAAVAQVASDHQLDYVPYIDTPVLAEWQQTSGLSVTELAMIQPTYDYRDPKAQVATLGRLAWLEGRWEMSRSGRIIQEEWLPALGNTMMCIGRVVNGDSLVDHEIVILRQHGSRLAYEAHPMGQKPATFLSTQITDHSVVFENLSHDFPQRIIYQRKGTDTLVAWVEGLSNGKTRRNQFVYRRIDAR